MEKDKLIKGKWQKLPNGQQVLAKKLAMWQDFPTAVRLVTQAETS